MTKLETYAINQLSSFINIADEQGICYNGRDIDPSLQILIINIVRDYVDEYIQESDL